MMRIDHLAERDGDHGFGSLDHLRIDVEDVYVFDFDGVIASSKEDEIYKHDFGGRDTKIVERAAAAFDIDCSDLEDRYKRHIVYQAAAWYLRLPIDPGPAFGIAQHLSLYCRIFVLTARSSWHASERMKNFLLDSKIIPIEVFNVGRVYKNLQLELLCKEYAKRRMIYLEDSEAQLDYVKRLNLSNLELILVRSSVTPEEVRSLELDFFSIMERALLGVENDTALLSNRYRRQGCA